VSSTLLKVDSPFFYEKSSFTQQVDEPHSHEPDDREFFFSLSPALVPSHAWFQDEEKKTIVL